MGMSGSEEGLESLLELDEVVLAVVNIEFDGVVMEVGEDAHLDVQDVDHLSHVHAVDPSLLHLIVLPLSLVFPLQLR
jgi:hypothetical protein